MYCPFWVSKARVPAAAVVPVVVAGAVPVAAAVDGATWKSKDLMFPYWSRMTFLVLSPDWSMIWFH